MINQYSLAMSLKEQVEQEIKLAMKAKDKDALRALRSIKSLILLAETEKDGGKGLSREAELQLLNKAAKQRRESAEIYAREGRPELAEGEVSELAIIERFLPEQLSDEAIEAGVAEIIAETGASSMKDMGKVMGIATQRFAGKADNKTVSQIVRAKLQ